MTPDKRNFLKLNEFEVIVGGVFPALAFLSNMLDEDDSFSGVHDRPGLSWLIQEISDRLKAAYEFEPGSELEPGSEVTP